jgi:DMSO reductase anchor subunit
MTSHATGRARTETSSDTGAPGRSSVARTELIPATPQRLWGIPAVANFALGGLGAGFYLAAYLVAAGAPSPAVRLASWLAPALVLAGFVAVATEAGRPLRGPRVLTRIGTSWMSRELWVGGAFVLLALFDRVSPSPGVRALAGLAALALVVAQGAILRAARGIPAWNVAVMPLAFVVSAAASGAGLLLLTGAVAGRAPSAVVTGLTLAVLVLALVVWLAFVRWSREPAFTRAMAPLRHGPIAIELIAIGYVAPFVLTAAALALPSWSEAMGMLAGITMILGQIRAKSALVLTAGMLRPVALDVSLTFRRSS